MAKPLRPPRIPAASRKRVVTLAVIVAALIAVVPLTLWFLGGRPGPDKGSRAHEHSIDAERQKDERKRHVLSYRVVQTRLGTLHSGIRNMTFSSDGCHLAYLDLTGTRARVVVDGRKGHDITAVVSVGDASPIVFSPNGERFGYVAMNEGHVSSLVVDGEEVQVHKGMGITGPVFSPDGRRIAYVVSDKGRRSVVVDSMEGPRHDSIAIGKDMPVFSPDGKRVAYLARRGKRWFAVVDGQEQPEYDAVSNLRFSADGRRVAYIAWRDKRSFAVVDGQERKEYDAVGNLRFSTDGRRVAYLAWRDKKPLVVVDGREGPEYDGIGKDMPVFSSDGKRIGWLAERGNRWFAVVDGQEGTEYDAVSNLALAPSGKRIAYSARRGDKWIVVVDGQRGPACDFVAALRFSPDGKHVVYVAGRGKRGVVVVDGQQGLEYDDIGETGVVFSPDGEHTAYRARSNRSHFVVIDGERGPEFRAIFKNGPVFRAGGELEYLAVKDTTLYRVKHVPVYGPSEVVDATQSTSTLPSRTHGGGQTKGEVPGDAGRSAGTAEGGASSSLPPRAAQAGERTIVLDCGGGMRIEMVYVQPGRFTMGSRPVLPGGGKDEPPHEVKLTRGFHLGKYEVTQEQYQAVMRASPSGRKGAKRPVEQVSWNDATEFCARLSRRSGRQVRLPTEAEWEYACRAGTLTSFCCGDDGRDLGDYAWLNINAGGETHPVGGKRPNAWGLHDMHGNVSEWCSDWYDSSYYADSSVQDPTGPASGERRVSRGGAYWCNDYRCRSSHRQAGRPTLRSKSSGFRVVVEAAVK